MIVLFINLSALQIALIAALTLIVVVFAVFKILKRENGISQILWILSVILLPPFLALIYILKIMLFDKSTNLIKN